jgi:hypothetical protein
MARPFNFYDLPLKARNLVYSYLGMSCCTIDLNYNQLIVFPQGTYHRYPGEEIVEKVHCFHEGKFEISRCEDYHTLAKYWTCEWDEYATRLIRPYPNSCRDEGCRGAPFITDWLKGRHGTRKEAPEPFITVLGSNHFRICRSSPSGFAPFFDIPRDMLYDLGTLTVRLDGELVECIELGGGWERIKRLSPLKLYSRCGKNAMKEWDQLVQRLVESIRPGQLTLYLIVSVEDFETAQTVLKPLERLPTLKDCGLFLNKNHIPGLERLAQETVKRLTAPDYTLTQETKRSIGSARTKPSFRYLDLPIEIRWRILEYSDLVFDNTLKWEPPLSSLGKVPHPYCSCIQYVDRYVINEDEHFPHFPHFPDCTRSIIDATELQRYTNGVGVTVEREVRDCRCDSVPHSCCKLPDTGFCECIFNCGHSAYSSNSIVQPRNGAHSLFMVSKQVNQDAVSVFFRRNQFAVVPPAILQSIRGGSSAHNYPRLVVLPMRRLELSLFLSSLATNALQHIRYLEWVLPSFENYTTAPRSAYLDYLDTIELMARAMNLPQLTLVVDLRVVTQNQEWMNHNFWCPPRKVSNGKVYDRILQPFCRLKGLKDFFVHLRRVWKVLPEDQRYRHDLNWGYDNDEMRYEKAVMGEEYNSGARGKRLLNRYQRNSEGSWVEHLTPRGYVDYDPGFDGYDY